MSFLPQTPDDAILFPPCDKSNKSNPTFAYPKPPPGATTGDVTISKQRYQALSYEEMSSRPWKLPNELFDLKHEHVLDDCWRAVAFGGFAYASRIYMQLFNHVEVHRKEVLANAVLKRPPGQPLITVTNHNSCVDDPTLFAMVAPVEVWRDSRSVRWAWCASEVCFKSAFLQKFFTATKTSPMYRGSGLDQAPVQFAIERLRHGDWYHIFPEGFVIQKNDNQMGRLKWGLGKIVAGVRDLDPILIPFVHVGMENVNPLPENNFKTGKKVRAIVGDPIPLQDLFENFQKLQDNNPGWGDPFPPSEELLYHEIVNRTSDEMSKLLEQIDQQ